MANVIDLSYAAGIIDGEGTIGITELRPNIRRRPNGTRERKSAQHRIYVAVSMTDAAVPMWLHATFGGNIQSVSARQPHHKPSVRWSMSSKRAADFCRLVGPHMKVKKLQADLAIRFYDERLTKAFQGSAGVPGDELARRRMFVAEIKTLNQRGVAAGG